MESDWALTMRMELFVRGHRLRMKRDACGDLIVRGKLGHIAEHGGGFFSVVLEDTASGPSRARALLGRRRKALAAGFRLHQAGDCESVLLFDPAKPHQAKLAIRLVMARPKRRASEAQLANLKKSLGRTAFQRPGTAHPSHYAPLGVERLSIGWPNGLSGFRA